MWQRIVYLSANIILLAFLQSKFDTTVAEETAYSIENNRVLKLFAEAEARSASTTTTIRPSIDSANVSEKEYASILTEVKQLRLVILRMQQMNHLDEQVEKCIASLKRHNEYKSKSHWLNILRELKRNHRESSAAIQQNIIVSNEFSTITNSSNSNFLSQDQEAMEDEKALVLRRIVIKSYEGIRPNILPIIHFINYTKIISGFDPLLQEMRDYDHIYNGNEVFLIARLIRLWCGTESELYEELIPIGIQYIDSYSVHLLNENNQGLLYYKPKEPCRGRYCTNHELFTFHHSVDDFSPDQAARSTWTFLPTNTSDSVSDTMIKFYMRNDYIEQQEMNNDSTSANTTSSNNNNQTMLQYKYVNVGYEYKLSFTQKSIIEITLVNHTENAVRIRIVQTHLVKRLIMGEKNPSGSSINKLSIMGTEDRFEKANDGNWVVLPLEKLDANILNEKLLWNKNAQCSIMF